MLLEVLTRHLSTRPNSLARCIASLQRQTCDRWLQTLLIDDVGRGVEWANRNLAHYAPNLQGDYIWILDDDDICTAPDLVAQLQFLCADSPDVIMAKGYYAGYGVLPDLGWGIRPLLNHVGSSNFIVRRDIWQQCADAWPDRLAGDYAFINVVFELQPKVTWWNKQIMLAGKKGNGKPE